jgi:hypothetical protein
MAMPDIQYQRLTHSGMLTVNTRGSLWLGADHLLSVESNGYRETYKRFYFSDIQAITVQKTGGFKLWNIIAGIVILMFLIFTIAEMSTSDNDKMIGMMIFGGITGLFLLILLLHLTAGRTCKTFLRTAVQIERLPGMNRVPKTRKVLAKIRPLIATAQGGELSAETVLARMQEWSTASATTPANAVVDDPKVPPRLTS